MTLGPLSLLLLFSLQKRISGYGFTEPRYYGLMFGFWLLAVSLLYTFRPNGSTRTIPASLALMCLLSATGPWSAFSVSLASQRRELSRILAPLGAIENGCLITTKRPMGSRDEAAVRSILNRLILIHGKDRFTDLLVKFDASRKDQRIQDTKENPWTANVDQIMSFLTGSQSVADAQPNSAVRYIKVELDKSQGIPVGGFRFLSHASFSPIGGAQRVGDLTIEFGYGENNPKISLEGKALDVTAIKALMNSIVQAGNHDKHFLPAPDMSAKFVAESREWLLVVNNFQGTTMTSSFPYVSQIDVDLLEK